MSLTSDDPGNAAAGTANHRDPGGRCGDRQGQLTPSTPLTKPAIYIDQRRHPARARRRPLSDPQHHGSQVGRGRPLHPGRERRATGAARHGGHRLERLPDQVASVFHREVEDVIKRRRPAPRRWLSSTTPGASTVGLTAQAAHSCNVHGDYTERSGPQRVRDLIPADRVEDWLDGRFAVINLWRPCAPIRIGAAGLEDPTLSRDDIRWSWTWSIRTARARPA